MYVLVFVDFIFAGELLKDEKTLDSYGIKDGFTVYVMKKCPEPEPIGMKHFDRQIMHTCNQIV